MSGTLRLPQPTWFAGCGNMGGAILDGWRTGGMDLGAVTVIRPSGKPVEGARTVTSFAEAGAPPKLVILAFKPQKLDEIAPELRKFLSAKTTVVSILAGVEVASLRQRFPGVGAIVRAMPNLPVAVRRGVTGLFSPDVDQRTEAELNNLFSALGFAMWMADESKLAAIGSVAGAHRGLTHDIATSIARETVLGTAWMAATTGEEMESVAKRVASPRGTTEAGLAVLDKDHAIDALIVLTIEAAARRGAELAEEARGAQLEEPARLS
jgi:pyrroline-5-carboxylate reductase